MPPASSACRRRSAYPSKPTPSRLPPCAVSAPSWSSTGATSTPREHCEQLASEHGYRYVHSGNEPLLIAGVATETLELLEEQPQTDVIVVPVGGGSSAAGACIVAKAINPAIKVIGVQSDAAPAAFRSWRERRLVEDKMETCAEGLVVRCWIGC
jgi:threonine dehydratase